MQAFYADHFVLPLPDGHRFPMAKYAMLRERLQAEMPSIELKVALAARVNELSLVHTPRYVDAVLRGTLTATEQREIGFPWSAEMAERACRSVGASLQAARVALGGGGVSANLAGGTHHAYPDKGSGFCVFNDVAVTTRQMQVEAAGRLGAKHGHTLQVAVIDLDVHQGDGTAFILGNDPNVFTLSLHGAKNFPVRKQKSHCDLALPDGCQDDEYLLALAQGLEQLEQRFAPDLIIYLAGADPHEGDRLGRLALTDDGMQTRDRQVFDWAWQHRVPLVMTMAGGYGRDIDSTLRVQANTYRIALEYGNRWQKHHSSLATCSPATNYPKHQNPMQIQHVTPVPIDKSYRLLNHGPTVLVSAEHAGETDVMAAAWACVLDYGQSPKVTVVLDKATRTRTLIEASGCFALQLPTKAMAGLTLGVGTDSAHDVPDKLSKHGVTTFFSPGSAVPLVDGCVGWLLCKRVPERHNEQVYDLFIGEIVAAWADERVFREGRWFFDTAPDDLRTIHHVAGGQFYAIGASVQG